jgi:drug/metabolite transporter (DMT)-like permease
VTVGTGRVGPELDVGFTATAWWAVVGVAVVGTVIVVTCFLAAVEIVGPSRASILSTLEPVVTVVLAYLLLEERLGPVQLAGGALVLAACILLQMRGPRTGLRDVVDLLRCCDGEHSSTRATKQRRRGVATCGAR